MESLIVWVAVGEEMWRRLGVVSFAATQLLSGEAIDKPKLRSAMRRLHGITTLCAAMQRIGGDAASHWPFFDKKTDGWGWFYVFVFLCLMFWGRGGAAFFRHKDKKTDCWERYFVFMSLCLMFREIVVAFF